MFTFHETENLLDMFSHPEFTKRKNKAFKSCPSFSQRGALHVFTYQMLTFLEKHPMSKVLLREDGGFCFASLLDLVAGLPSAVCSTFVKTFWETSNYGLMVEVFLGGWTG